MEKIIGTQYKIITYEMTAFARMDAIDHQTTEDDPLVLSYYNGAATTDTDLGYEWGVYADKDEATKSFEERFQLITIKAIDIDNDRIVIDYAVAELVAYDVITSDYEHFEYEFSKLVDYSMDVDARPEIMRILERRLARKA